MDISFEGIPKQSGDVSKRSPQRRRRARQEDPQSAGKAVVKDPDIQFTPQLYGETIPKAAARSFLKALGDGLTRLRKKLSSFYNELPGLYDELTQLCNELTQLCNELTQLCNELIQLCNELIQLCDKFPQLRDGFPQLCNVLPQLCNVLPQLRNVLPQLRNVPSKLYARLSQEFEGVWNAARRSSKLSDIAPSDTPLGCALMNGFSDFLRCKSKTDIKIWIAIQANRYGMGDVVEKPDQLFLDSLSENLHFLGKSDGVETVIFRTGEVFPTEFREGIDDLTKNLGEMRSCLPQRLFTEEDMDHKNAVPNIRELLALEMYMRCYEAECQRDNLYRGGDRLPDFVYRENDKVLRSYDPMQLPDLSQVSPNGIFANDTYLKHAGGKIQGAVCILDASNASEDQLGEWIKIFGDEFELIKPVWPSRMEHLIYMCNTFVVSYGKNRDTDALAALQNIFEMARKFLENKTKSGELEKWRRNEMGGEDAALGFDVEGAFKI